MKPASRKFKNQGSGVYRKNLHGWGMVEARQQGKLKRVAEGHKVHQEGPKEYRVNVPQKRVNTKAPKAPKRSPTYHKMIKETADPWIGTKPLRKKQVRNGIGLKNIAIYHTSTTNKTYMDRKCRTDTWLAGMPKIVSDHTIQVIPKIAKHHKICKNRMLAIAFLSWHRISNLEIERFVGISKIKLPTNYRFLNYMMQVRDVLELPYSDDELRNMQLRAFKAVGSWVRKNSNANVKTKRKLNFHRLYRREPVSKDWQQIRHRETQRRSAEKKYRGIILRKVFNGTYVSRNSFNTPSIIPSSQHGYKRKLYKPFAQYEKREPAETEEWHDIRTRELIRRYHKRATRKRQLCKVFTGDSGNSEKYKKMHRESTKRWREKSSSKSWELVRRRERQRKVVLCRVFQNEGFA